MRRRVSAILRDRSSPGGAINWAAPETPFGQSAAPGSHRSHYRIHVLASAERARALATMRTCGPERRWPAPTCALVGGSAPSGLARSTATGRPPSGPGCRQPRGVAQVCFLRMRSSACRCRLDPGGSRLRPEPATSCRRAGAAALQGIAGAQHVGVGIAALGRVAGLSRRRSCDPRQTLATRRGCRTNHSETRCINWSTGSHMLVVLINAHDWKSESKSSA